MTIVSYYDNRVSNWAKETFKEYLVNRDKGKFTTQTILPQEEIDQVNKDAEKQRHNKYAKEFKYLIEHAKYLYSSQNKTPNNPKKKNVAKYHYFEVLVKTKKKVYKIILDTEEYIEDIKTKPQKVHLYNIHEQ